MPKASFYLSAEEEDYVAKQEKGFVKGLVRIAMNGGEVLEPIREVEAPNKTGMRWLTCTPENRAKMAEFYRLMSLDYGRRKK